MKHISSFAKVLVLATSLTALLQFCTQSVQAKVELANSSKAGGESAQSDAGEKKTKAKSASGSKEKSSDTKSDEDEPKLSVTEHSVVIGGETIKYRATAGFMQLKDFQDKFKDKSGLKSDKDKEYDKSKKPKHLAKMFFIAYTREGVDSQKRPVSFSFNGGPGSSSVWLHMGALGPRRAVLSDRGEALPPPFRFEDNPYSWLDESDLVFIDPVSTGYSRSEPDFDVKKFHGYQEDIESVGEFIRLYTTKYKRWNSPKFVVGESYGTTRAAGLSDFLQERYGLYLNGIVLVSAVLNFATLDFSTGNDVPYALFMPGYAATAWYHKRLSPELQAKPLSEVLKEAEDFVDDDLLVALFHGDRLDADKKQEVASKLSRLIGLPASYVRQLEGRIPADLFFTHLLMDTNQIIGRFDSRYAGVRSNPGRDNDGYDPSFEAVKGTYTAVMNDYVRRELQFESELPYEILANVWPWSFKSFENRYLNVSEDLRKAMICNPYLKVWFCCGYYDLATPYYAAKYTVDQMALAPSLSKNISLTYYEGGHMMYVCKPALKQMKSDFQNFIKQSILPASQVVPAAAR